MAQTLYRKWRPKTFDQVVGQEHITRTLKQQVATDHCSHAYLFIGTRGTGKTTCARILAKAVNCENPVDGNPCNVCPTCLGIDAERIPDVLEIDAASYTGVENIRQLREDAAFAPAQVRMRVYIVDEVHMLSNSAFNALLKILEEPPSHLMFILATTELQKVPATILSRCQRHSFKRIDPAVISARLRYVAEQEGISLTPEAASLLATLAEGGMRDALSMLDQCSGREQIDADTVYSALGMAGKQDIVKLLRCVTKQDTASALTLFHKLWQAGKDPASVLGELAALQRDILLRLVAPQGLALLSEGYETSVLDDFGNILTTGQLVSGIRLIQSALNEMKSGQARMVCELCLVTLSEPGLNDSLPMLRERVAALERLVRDGIPTVSLSDQTDCPSEPNVSREVPPISLDEPAVSTETPSVAEDEKLWPTIRERLDGVFIGGVYAILNDSAAVTGKVSGDVLTLTVADNFSARQLENESVKAKLRDIAAQVAERSITVRVTVADDEPEENLTESDKLQELRNHPFVQFK